MSTDSFFNGLEAGRLINGVNETLGYENRGLDRDAFNFRDEFVTLFAYPGNLAESWETPDPLTYVFYILPAEVIARLAERGRHGVVYTDRLRRRRIQILYQEFWKAIGADGISGKVARIQW